MDAHVFVSVLLDCGYLDTDYLFRLTDAYGIDPRDLMDDVHDYCPWVPHINDLIHAAFERVATEFIFELPEELYCSNHKFYHSIFTNCMDSSLCFDEPNIQELYEEWRRF